MLEAMARLKNMGPSPSSRKTGTVLIVDDQQAVRCAAENAARSLGFETLAADSGHQALEIFAARHREIAVVLLDLSVPEIGGREVWARLKQIDPAVRVVLSSGYEESEALGDAGGEEPAAFLQKPYTVSQLETQLDRALGTAARI